MARTDNGDTPIVVDYTGRGRWVRLAEAMIETRTSVQRAVDRGDTAIHLTNSTGVHGGRLAIEFTEPDGARWSMTYDAPGTGDAAPLAKLEGPDDAGNNHA